MGKRKYYGFYGKDKNKDDVCICGHARKQHKNEFHGFRGKNTHCEYDEKEFFDGRMGIWRHSKERCKCEEFKLK